MEGVMNTFSTQTSMAAPVNFHWDPDPVGVSTGKRDAYTVSERRSRLRRRPESRDRLASRPLTPLTARNFQRAAADSCEPTRQWNRRPTRFPPPLPPPPISAQKTKDN